MKKRNKRKGNTSNRYYIYVVGKQKEGKKETMSK